MANAASKLDELPVNHSPQFAPVLHPTMETGVEALAVGALACVAQADIFASGLRTKCAA
jgi:hippurate hydrolase